MVICDENRDSMVGKANVVFDYRNPHIGELMAAREGLLFAWYIGFF